MTPQELKASILQLAIQGKLVPQLPEEGTGEELFLQIQAEKQALIKSCKIKKEKTLPEITEDEMPFDIPESWKWCRITECGVFISGYTPKPPELSDNGILPYFKVSDMNTPGNELFLVNTCNYLNSSTSKYFLKNTIVYPKNGGAVFTNKKRILAQDSVVDLNTGGYYPIAPLDLMFVYIFFSNIDFRKCYKGTALPTIDMDKLKSKLFPLPPLAEQKRIVAKIDELLPLIDRYDQAWSKLEDFNKRFPVDMQKSILQMAIQGKLVPQRPEEGTGEELFQQIQAEKQALIKAGKIKKEKPLPEISEDEIPFDIPETWKWARLQEITSVLGDGIHGTPIFDETGAFYFVNGNNLANGNIAFKSDTKKVSIDEYEKYKKPLDENTVLVSINGTIGNYAFYAGEPIILGKSACYFSLLTGIDKEYICHLINTKSFMDYAVKEATQTTIKNVSLKAMRMFPVPLPPLAEQKRIVAKLEEILPLCERLK